MLTCFTRFHLGHVKKLLVDCLINISPDFMSPSRCLLCFSTVQRKLDYKWPPWNQLAMKTNPWEKAEIREIAQTVWAKISGEGTTEWIGIDDNMCEEENSRGVVIVWVHCEDQSRNECRTEGTDWGRVYFTAWQWSLAHWNNSGLARPKYYRSSTE